MIKTSKEMIKVSILFLIIALIFLLIAMFAPLSSAGNLLTSSDVEYHISKIMLYLISIFYFILGGIGLLNYFNRKIYIDDDSINYINTFGKKIILDPKECELKIHRARFDLFYKESNRKICSFSFLNDGDVFDFIKKIERSGVIIK